jgi:hypothetical protein
MLDAVIQDLIRQQRPYYLPQGNLIKGVGNHTGLFFGIETLIREATF